jgi:YVTN family beta-propeller protein
MRDEERTDALYPNRGPGDEAVGDGEGDRPRPGVSRRRLLAGSAAAGAVATAGCAGDGSSAGGSGTDDGAAAGDDPDGPATVYVFNTGDRTVSVVDVASDEVVATPFLGATASFPSNQYAPGQTRTAGDPLWLNVDRGVRAVDAATLSTLGAVETGSGANWLEVTPDRRHLLVSAREPAHRQLRLDADPASETFGEVTGEIDRRPEGGRGDREGPGPCDVTVHPDGAYAYVPDLFGDTLTVIDVESFEVVTQVDVPPVDASGAGSGSGSGSGSGASRPWMATASWDGQTLLVEHDEGSNGTESVWDLSDPAAPEERVRLTAADGLGGMPLTSEIGPDSETGYVFTPDTEDVTAVDLVAGEVTGRIDVGGAAFVGTWDPAREKLYVPVQSSDEVAVIDHAAGEVTATIPVGSRPYGATAGFVRPREDAAGRVVATLAGLGVGIEDDVGTTYCIGRCACGHEL